MMKILKNISCLIIMLSLTFIMACSDDEGFLDGNEPIAVAGIDQEVLVGEEVMLDGSSSFDIDGDDLSYSWSITSSPNGSGASISNATSSIASITPDVNGTYVISLTVNDGNNDATDQLTITASDAVGGVPTAVITDLFGNAISEANENNVIGIDSEIQLSGIFSSDPDFDELTYEWSAIVSPTGSTPQLTEPSTGLVNFQADVLGNYSVQLKVDDGNGNLDSTSVIIEIAQLPIIIDEDISSSTTWTNIYDEEGVVDYLVTKSTVFLTADLTIEPGVVIAFENDHGLSVETAGSINAIGTATENIVFQGLEDETGYWKGIIIKSNSTSNELAYCEVEGAGSSGFDGANLLANVMVQSDGQLRLNNSTLSNGAGSGLYVRSEESRLIDFENNVITGNNYPVTALINNYHFFDGLSDFTGNTNDYINTENGSTTDEDVTWKKLTVPYLLDDATEFIASEIEIEAGAVFVGRSGSGFDITGSGSLNATGTASENIVFRGFEDTEGFWKGFSFETNNTNNKLIYVEISNAGESGFDGANIQAGVMVQSNGRLIMQNSTIQTSTGSGLYMRDEEVVLENFTNNTLTANEVPATMPFNGWHFLDETSDFTGNDDDYIEGINASNLDEEVVWKAINVPYRLPSNSIQEVGNGGITIEPGTHIISAPDGALQISDEGYLTISGTSTEMVIMEGEQDVPGYWRGIRFKSNTLENSINYLSISNGGSVGFDGGNRKANIEVAGNNSRLEISNSNIEDSDGYGIRVQTDGNITFSNLSYSGNALSGNQDSGGIENDNL